jgi:hypothetical protein
MPWTPPRTWTNTERVTSKLLNDNVYGNIEYMRYLAPISSVVDTDNSVFSTSSTSFVDVTPASITLITGATAQLFIFASGTISPGSATCTFRFMIDGVALGDATNGQAYVNNSEACSFTLDYISDALSAGSHTVKLQMKVASGTRTMNMLEFTVFEGL